MFGDSGGNEKKYPRLENASRIAERLRGRIKERTGVPEMPTGIRSLDDKIFGLHRKELAVISGKPSDGKSTLLYQIAGECADKHFMTVLISLETSNESNLERMFCGMMEQDGWQLRTGKIPVDFDAKFTFFENWLKGVSMVLVDDYAYTPEECRILLSEIDLKPDVIMLDYIQLTRSGAGIKKNEAIAAYLQIFKEMAMHNNAAALIASQLNVEGETKWCSEIFEMADTVLECRWPYRHDEEEKDMSKHFVTVKKQKHGSLGKIELKFTPAQFRLEDLPLYAESEKYFV